MMIFLYRSAAKSAAQTSQHDRVAIDDELLVAVLQRRFDNPRIAAGPVVTLRLNGRTRAPSR
jgi:hypothetical protein